MPFDHLYIFSGAKSIQMSSCFYIGGFYLSVVKSAIFILVPLIAFCLHVFFHKVNIHSWGLICSSPSLSLLFSLSLPLSAYWHPPQGHVKIDLKKQHTTPALAISLRSGFQPTFSVIHILLECHLTNRILEAVSIPSLYSLTFWTFSFHWPWLGKPPILV